MLFNLFFLSPILILFSLSTPNLFIITYILFNIWFGGFIPKDTWLYLNYENILFLFDIVSLISTLIIFSVSKINRSFRNIHLYFLFFFILFIILGFINNGGSLWSSLSASKGISSIFFLFFICLINHKVNRNLLLKFVVFIGFYQSVIQILYFFYQIYPYGYNLVNTLDISSGLQFKHPLILLSVLTLFHLYKFRIFKINLIDYFIYIIILFALITQEHRSIIAGYFLLLIFLNKKKYFEFDLKYLLGSLVILFLIIDILSELTFEIINLSGSISSRLNIQQFRIDLIKEKLFFGWGFIGKSSELGNQIFVSANSIHKELISTVDGGFIDLLIKFGIIGMFLYAIILFKISIFLNEDSKIYYRSFLYSYFCMSITLSPLTYHFGLIPLIIIFIFSMQNGKILR